MATIDYTSFLQSLPGTALEPWLATLPEQIERCLSAERFGDLPQWLQALEQLPTVTTDQVELQSGVELGSTVAINEAQREQIRACLQALIPWRKGPYRIHGIHIDTEWRSDWKWERVLPHLAPLQGRTVLDVGCGNGYHCWRMLGEGARQVIGIDPSPRFVVQFYMLKHFIGAAPVELLPVGIEALPPALQAFDTTFSMGVLYHRRSPMDHLRELKASLKPGGQVVLETLVIEGGLGEVLVPEGRYCMMNNVWFLPSCDTLLSWMRKCGFNNPRLVDCTRTSVEEQRSTEWMKFHSLPQFLDPHNPELTAEGHPAPLRAVVIAEA
ncbi:tRNA 5-methoxyuridine(34)/uridine 5-oxyacetic acid(34) synthase CmoB [Pseudomaricurvus alcaniphilus]|uniref:tRNA 5-methoxyuridine(34)/uridine 5-oxyacetic acid(34) synthase CmoB n=1 Tax=Pseudomaricurvus alcaniphilus TaxID=1166482 RepID=UPI0014096450|nr:tRNA 5-methoxyuridine(34)/uridine 5-oxyacetic acid(34) synthase CmoB [Pseudomaricurvus alcaniphilus]NHN37483.1 tRNA 5-methoxyuridine(34)/uridine 5-oxyacetic acid(34) synthase CmoB [Pseudomaricurvus alcaniphilus]